MADWESLKQGFQQVAKPVVQTVADAAIAKDPLMAIPFALFGVTSTEQQGQEARQADMQHARDMLPILEQRQAQRFGWDARDQAWKVSDRPTDTRKNLAAAATAEADAKMAGLTTMQAEQAVAAKLLDAGRKEGRAMLFGQVRQWAAKRGQAEGIEGSDEDRKKLADESLAMLFANEPNAEALEELYGFYSLYTGTQRKDAPAEWSQKLKEYMQQASLEYGKDQKTVIDRETQIELPLNTDTFHAAMKELMPGIAQEISGRIVYDANTKNIGGRAINGYVLDSVQRGFRTRAEAGDVEHDMMRAYNLGSPSEKNQFALLHTLKEGLRAPDEHTMIEKAKIVFSLLQAQKEYWGKRIELSGVQTNPKTGAPVLTGLDPAKIVVSMYDPGMDPDVPPTTMTLQDFTEYVGEIDPTEERLRTVQGGYRTRYEDEQARLAAAQEEAATAAQATLGREARAAERAGEEGVFPPGGGAPVTREEINRQAAANAAVVRAEEAKPPMPKNTGDWIKLFYGVGKGNTGK